MVDEQRFAQVWHRLTLADSELQKIDPMREGDADKLKIAKNHLAEIMGIWKSTYYAGPGGYDPAATYEKCDQCSHYRLKP